MVSLNHIKLLRKTDITLIIIARSKVNYVRYERTCENGLGGLVCLGHTSIWSSYRKGIRCSGY